MIEPVKAKILAALDTVVAKNRSVFHTYIGPKAVEMLTDDALVTRVAEEVYPLLPLPVRLLIKQEPFSAFLLNHREVLISALDRSRPNPPSSEAGQPG